MLKISCVSFLGFHVERERERERAVVLGGDNE